MLRGSEVVSGSDERVNGACGRGREKGRGMRDPNLQALSRLTSASPLTLCKWNCVSVCVCVSAFVRGVSRRDIIIMCIHNVMQSDPASRLCTSVTCNLNIGQNLRLQLKNIQRPRNKTMHVHGSYNSVMCGYSLDISFLDVRF